MNKKNIRILLVICLICIIVLVAFLCVYSQNNKKESQNPQDADATTSGTEITSETTENFDIRPDTEENAIPTVINTESTVSVNDVSTQNLSVFLNSIIDDSYKTSSFACDIITQESMDTNIISIQIESNDFSEEANCINTAKSIIEQTMNSEYFNEIQAFDFSFIANSQVRYIMLVDNVQDISSSDMIVDYIKIQEF